jgi:ADP-heptose:LPS heptosyltransferase
MSMIEKKRGQVIGESSRLIKEFLEAFESSGRHRRDHIARLAELATSEDRETSKQATGAFFTSLVEPLADSFDPRSVSLYNRVFAQLIEHCRAIDRSGVFGGELERLGIRGEQDLVARAESLRHKRPPAWINEASLDMRRVILISRVTLGADVAITSVIIERMKRAFPRARITLVGGRKAAELFGGDARLSFKEIGYDRAGPTLERLLSWVDLLGCVRELTEDLSRGEYLIIDPDSRLTQLGLLPLSPAKNRSEDDCIFFPSREYGSLTSRSLAQLTSEWLDEVFGHQEPLYPQLSLAARDLAVARESVKRIRRDARPIVSINFGVGENPVKRIEGDFETQLVNHLIRDGAAIILDKGAGEDEMRRADLVISSAASATRDGRAIRVIELSEESLMAPAGPDDAAADVIVWSGRIGMLAALIGESDLYIGYDSAGQHIAAALGVPCLDVFAGFNSQRFLCRWRPTGKAESRVIAARAQASSNAQEILSDALRHAREMLKK